MKTRPETATLRGWSEFVLGLCYCRKLAHYCDLLAPTFCKTDEHGFCPSHTSRYNAFSTSSGRSVTDSQLSNGSTSHFPSVNTAQLRFVSKWSPEAYSWDGDRADKTKALYKEGQYPLLTLLAQFTLANLDPACTPSF